MAGAHRTDRGTTWYTPVRTDAGGTRVRFWVDARLQAALQQLADARGITLNQAARVALDNWLADLEAAGHHPSTWIAVTPRTSTAATCGP